MEDFYGLTKQKISEFGGAFLINLYDSPSKLIMSQYPEFPWEMYKFNKVSHVGRELKLFYIDISNNVINNYTLSVPKLVIKSNDTTIKGGKIKGDIYVESDGLILDDTKIELKIYFK